MTAASKRIASLDGLRAISIAPKMIADVGVTVSIVPRFSSPIFLAILLAVMAAITTVGFDEYPVVWGFVPAIIAIMVLILVERSDALLNGKAIVWVGLLSYSLYLWQQPFMAIAGPFDIPLLRLTLSFALAAFSYYCIERPGLRIFKPRRATAVSLPEVSLLE